MHDMKFVISHHRQQKGKVQESKKILHNISDSLSEVSHRIGMIEYGKYTIKLYKQPQTLHEY